MTRARLLTPLALALLLGGCASFSPDGGLGPAHTPTQPHTGQAVQRTPTDAAHARTAEDHHIAQHVNPLDAVAAQLRRPEKLTQPP